MSAQHGDGQRVERRDVSQLASSAARTHPAPQPVEAGWQLAITSIGPMLPAAFMGCGTIELLSRPGFAMPVSLGQPLEGCFARVPLADITPFLVLRVELQGKTQTVSDATVVRARLVDEPAGRLDALIARQVDTPSKFLRFLFLLLGLAGGGVPSWLQSVLGGSDEPGVDATRGLLELGVFEALTRALVTNPAALLDLERLVDRLRTTPEGRATLPEGFDELWAAVSTARQTIAE